MAQEVKYTLSLQDLLTGKLNQANDAANRFESTMGRAQSRLNGFGAALGVTFGLAAVTAFANKMVSAGTTVENSLTGLTTLLKDSAEAQGVVNATMEDATKTPFAFEGLLSANKALISAGVESKAAREDVLNLANAIAATGGGDDELQRMVVNLQQIKNVGKATALDIKQFAFAGVNVYKVLAEATGKPIEKIKDMEVSYDMLTMALKKAHDEGGIYYNGLENMQANTSVRISNLGDSVFQLSVKMFNDLKPAIDTIISGLASFVQAMTDGWNWLVRNKEQIVNVGKVLLDVAIGIGVVVGAYKLYQATLVVQYAWMMRTVIAESLMHTVKLTLAGGTSILTAAQLALNAAMAANPIGLLITALAVVAAGVVYAYQRFAAFRGILFSVTSIVKEVGAIWADIFTGLGKTIKGVLTWDVDLIKAGATQTVGAYRDAAYRLGKAAKEGYQAGVADFNKGEGDGLENAITSKNYNAPKTNKGAKLTAATATTK
jgi:tape measure domain-containing protein